MKKEVDYVLTVPIGTQHKQLLTDLATQDSRTLTGYCRHVLYQHLREVGLLTPEGTTTEDGQATLLEYMLQEHLGDTLEAGSSHE